MYIYAYTLRPYGEIIQINQTNMEINARKTVVRARACETLCVVFSFTRWQHEQQHIRLHCSGIRNNTGSKIA